MPEKLKNAKGALKERIYSKLYKELEALTAAEDDMIANMANISSAIRETFGFLWVGFYRVVGNRLLLGPFQGPVACTSIAYGKGVCGKAWEEAETIIVADVEQFPGHIACSKLSRSEIVIPVKRDNRVVALLDLDSDILDCFDEIDSLYLNKICSLL